MNEIALLHPGPCEEALLAFLEACGLSPAVKRGFADGEDSVIFYMDEASWKAFQGKLREGLDRICGIFGQSPPEISARPLDSVQWQEAWKRYAKIYRFGKDLIVKPSWRVLRTQPTCPVISLDPRMAFGTGGHASTRLCLRHLLQIRKVAPDQFCDVLDVGTGSGILAIAAARLGAERVVAVDIDRDALTVAEENARRNGVAELIEFQPGSLAGIHDRFDLILANINESVLTELFPEFARRLRSTGILVVSGILRKQGQAFLKKAVRAGLERRSTRVEKEWVSYSLILGKRTP